MLAPERGEPVELGDALVDALHGRVLGREAGGQLAVVAVELVLEPVGVAAVVAPRRGTSTDALDGGGHLVLGGEHSSEGCGLVGHLVTSFDGWAAWAST